MALVMMSRCYPCMLDHCPVPSGPHNADRVDAEEVADA